jgi:nucleoside transporter
MALGAIISTMFAGQLADRVMSSEYLMAIFHLGGAALLFGMAKVQDFGSMWWLALGYALLYNPTLAISNSLAFHNIPDATRDFPTLRVLGTIGWIVAGFSVDFVLGTGAAATNKPIMMAAVLSVVLGLFSLALPHTPPSGQRSSAFPFLQAFGLLKDFSFGIFFGISFAITIALAFYYTFTSNFLTDLGVQKVPTVMTFGQMSEIFFMLLLPFGLKRFGMKGVLCVGMCAWAARYGLFSLGHPFALVLIGVILHGVCFDFFLAAGFIHTDNKAPAEIRGSAQALFTFLTYGVGMWIGNIISGYVVQNFTTKVALPTPHDVTNWSKVWLVPAIGAAACLVLFILLWRDTPEKVHTVDAVAETAASPADPKDVSQTAV